MFVVNGDMTAELQSPSTQLYCMLVMMLSDQALEIVRNSSEGHGAEVWRKLLSEYEPGVGVRYGAMLQSLLKRRFGEHDETDLAREIESFERDISTCEQMSSDFISDATKHGLVCGGMAQQGLEQHIDLSISRLATHQALRDEIINCTVHVNGNQERQGGGRSPWSDKGKGNKKAAKGSLRREARARKEMRNWSDFSKVNASTSRGRGTRKRSAER